MSDDGGFEEFRESFLATASSRLRRSISARNRAFSARNCTLSACKRTFSCSSVSIRFSKTSILDFDRISFTSPCYKTTRLMSTPNEKNVKDREKFKIYSLQNEIVKTSPRAKSQFQAAYGIF